MSQMKENYSFPEKLGIGSTYVYITAMLVGFPAFYTGDLLSLISDKKDYFKFFAVIYGICLCPALIRWIWNLIQKKQKLTFQMDLLFVGILAAAVGLSTFFSLNREVSLSELTYRSVAADAFLFCILGYLGVRAFGRYTRGVVWSWLIGSTWIYIIGIFCACQIDFTNMQNGLATKENFLTPLGNTNFSASYVGLVLPLAFAMYMICHEKISKRIYSVVLYAGFMFAIFIKTQSSTMTVFVMFAIMIFFALEKEEWFLRYVDALGIFVLANTTIFLVVTAGGEQVYPLEGMGAFLTKGSVVLTQWILYIAFRLVLKKTEDRLRSVLAPWRKKILLGLIAVVVLAFAFLVLINLFLRDGVSGTVLKIFLIPDGLFNNRGIIWNATIDLVKHSSAKELLCGYGLQTYETAIQIVADQNLTQFFGYSIKDPHNEFLQTLTEMGILGVAGHFGLMISTLVYGIRNWMKNEMLIVTVLSVGCYLIQGLVNCYALTHLPILFILLGLCNGAMQKFTTSNSSSHVLF